MDKTRIALWAVLVALAIGTLSYVSLTQSAAESEQVRALFVPGSNAPYWQLTIAGAEAAAQQYHVDLSVAIPAGGHEQQSKILEESTAQDFDSVAISPRAPQAQNELLKKLAQDVFLITFDSDAPDSDRICYVGSDNYSAGRLAAKSVQEAIPDGGTVALLVANFKKDNAILRIRGFQEEMQRTALADDGARQYRVLEPMEDGIDKARCRENISRALQENPDIAAFVGMFSYHGPILLDVVKNIELEEKPKLITFDEEEVVLDGVQDGRIHATIVQDPYKFGFESVRMIAVLNSGNMEELPIAGHGSIFVRCEAINSENVAQFRTRLATRLNR